MWQYHPLLIKLFSISFKTIITQVSLEFNGHLRFVFFQAIPTGRTFKKSEISLKQGGGPILCCHNTFTNIPYVDILRHRFAQYIPHLHSVVNWSFKLSSAILSSSSLAVYSHPSLFGLYHDPTQSLLTRSTLKKLDFPCY